MTATRSLAAALALCAVAVALAVAAVTAGSDPLRDEAVSGEGAPAA